MIAGRQFVGIRRAVGVVASAVIACGCFAYRPADPSGLRTGEAVRVELTPSGAQELTQQVGPRVETLDGRVIVPRDSTLVVAVRQLTRSRGMEEFWTGDSVAVPVRGVSSLAVRRFDRNRTLLAVTGSVVGLFVVRRIVEEAGIFGSRPGRPPGTQ
jgi:hypothetical protein